MYICEAIDIYENTHLPFPDPWPTQAPRTALGPQEIWKSWIQKRLERLADANNMKEMSISIPNLVSYLR